MRKSREEAAATRQRIVAAAAREFCRNGVVASGLNDLMRAAGLTHGGFYKHFASKDQLIAEACAMAATASFERLAAAGPGAVATYLSQQHRDNPGGGCPLAAIGGELARGDGPTRAAATVGFLELVDLVAARHAAASPEAARARALAEVATLVGAVTLARLVSDPELSAAILREAERSLGAVPGPSPPGGSRGAGG